EGRAYALEDRCPHMGFPLHRGTCDAGLLTCHWHHARFDLESGSTLDRWADDTRAFDVEIHDDEVWVSPRPTGDEVARLQRRVREGLEDGLSLVIAKAVLGLLDAGADPAALVRTGLEFGARNRAGGWGAGLTTLVAMANVLERLDPEDRPAALIHGLVAVSNDTRGNPPRFDVPPLATEALEAPRLTEWYRRFVDTRSGGAAERVLATALAEHTAPAEVDAMLFAAVTDHVFVDGGHTLDFTNKAIESLAYLDGDGAAVVLPTVVAQAAAASRSEEGGEWRHPDDLAAMLREATAALPNALAAVSSRRGTYTDVGGLAEQLLVEDAQAVLDAVLDAVRAGADEEQVGRAVAYAASQRVVRFHIQNDFGDWDTVHHTFTAANALHQALVRAPTVELLRGALHGALRVYLDRFLNVPPARLPQTTTGSLEALALCFDVQGDVDAAGNAAYGFLRGGGSREALVAALGRLLFREDVGFHTYQHFEAGIRQAWAWPAGSEESALILTGVARFLAAHAPTRRELPTVITIASRLRRGEHLFEEAVAS
ncbi:MAG TPA: Rieske 2Fe-2S domain-containing protein, partial [Acidimicrobiia bacterium]|nr:Rieske 2Fe-2S domain-containing protein [Acidimicrobiia bacterium]